MKRTTDKKVWFNQPALFILIAFLVWIKIFSGFLSAQVSLANDAVAYYDHIKFFVDELIGGNYPLWDPHWNFGAPNEYFLRRFNGYNPLFGLLLILRCLGCSHGTSYLTFLALTYLLGALGLYSLLRRLTQNPSSAFLGFALFLFSSMSIKLFESYIVFVFVPLIWFFYFLIAFSQDHQPRQIIGLVLCLMLLVTTYVPFLAFNIIVSFLICFMIFFPKKSIVFLKGWLVFIRQHRILSILLLVLFLISLLPGWFFYEETKASAFTLPGRLMADEQKNIFEIKEEGITNWGMIEQIVYSSFFKNLRLIRFDVFYVPVWAYLLGLLGLAVQINKKIWFYIGWGVFLFCALSPQSVLFKWLFKHLFYFRLYRNLHFYLWLVMLPLGSGSSSARS